MRLAALITFVAITISCGGAKLVGNGDDASDCSSCFVVDTSGSSATNAKQTVIDGESNNVLATMWESETLIPLPVPTTFGRQVFGYDTCTAYCVDNGETCSDATPLNGGCTSTNQQYQASGDGFGGTIGGGLLFLCSANVGSVIQHGGCGMSISSFAQLEQCGTITDDAGDTLGTLYPAYVECCCQ